jgi:hypothetical protein
MNINTEGSQMDEEDNKRDPFILGYSKKIYRRKEYS